MLDYRSVRKFQQTPGTYLKKPQPPVYEGNWSIFVFWDTWGMFQGPIGMFLET